jgi:UDP-3-O-[3-hydroxymyristoyl] glucosamine N-acyltransferase
VIAGQAGVAGHLKVGDHVTVAAQAGVMTDTPDSGTYWGTPMQPIGDVKRQLVATRKLPELLKRVAELEKKLGGKSKPRDKK